MFNHMYRVLSFSIVHVLAENREQDQNQQVAMATGRVHLRGHCPGCFRCAAGPLNMNQIVGLAPQYGDHYSRVNQVNLELYS